MNENLFSDRENFKKVLREAFETASRFIEKLDDRPPAIAPRKVNPLSLSEKGIGAEEALQLFSRRYEPLLSGSAGGRYFGFVTGGSTPAALAGDWLVSGFDQNATGYVDSVVPQVEMETLSLLKSLIQISDEFHGCFVSGATMANFVGLAVARQWASQALGVNASERGLYGVEPISVLSCTPHSSSTKALSMLGMGRANIQRIESIPKRESVDLRALERALQASRGPSIFIAAAGTVNTVDFDDLKAIGELKQKYGFWLHVDAAFGAFAACSPKFEHLISGVNAADSITVDAHKWLNVPYDSGIALTRHLDHQLEVFKNYASYLGNPDPEIPDFVHRTPENSRRFRALPAWMSLVAYGKEGYREIIERNCLLAYEMGEKIEASQRFELLAPVLMNGCVFTLKERAGLQFSDIQRLLDRVREDGKTFLTPTLYREVPAIRLSISNWRTQREDIDLAWESICSID